MRRKNQINYNLFETEVVVSRVSVASQFLVRFFVEANILVLSNVRRQQDGTCSLQNH